MVNNFRFMILPWVRVKDLGSRILGFAVKVAPLDWERFYGVRPIAFETFVEMERFRGTVYRAANWISLGITEGKGRRGLNYFFHKKPKLYYLYLLERDYLPPKADPPLADKSNPLLRHMRRGFVGE